MSVLRVVKQIGDRITEWEYFEFARELSLLFGAQQVVIGYRDEFIESNRGFAEEFVATNSGERTQYLKQTSPPGST